jgi:hypothetical protein
MATYAELDGVIDHWVKLTGSTLFTEWAGAPARFFHIHGTPPFECFQISIDPSPAHHVTVLARAIDTNDDSESSMEETWEGAAEELSSMLESAVTTIEKWKERPGSNPQSPSSS